MATLLLDTDHITLLERGGGEGAAIRERLRKNVLDDIATTIVTYEEQMRGWLAFIAQFRDVEHQAEPYRRLEANLRFYKSIVVLPFGERSITEFQRLQQSKIKIGTMDLKIAAIALANNATLLTRNARDFSKVPDLHIEDWTL